MDFQGLMFKNSNQIQLYNALMFIQDKSKWSIFSKGVRSPQPSHVFIPLVFDLSNVNLINCLLNEDEEILK